MSIRKVVYSRSRRYKKMLTGHRSSSDGSSSSDRAASPCAPGRERRAMILFLIRWLLAQLSIVCGCTMRLTLAGNSRFRPSLPPSQHEPKYEAAPRRGRLGWWVACLDLRPPLQIHSPQGRPLYVRASKSPSFRSKCITPYRGGRE